MLVLALDTATPDLVTGLVDTATGEVREEVLVGTRGHNEQLMPTVMSLVDAAGHALTDLDAIVAGQGPGPFTGLRVGLATASALGQALNIPVYGVGTLDAIAARHSARRLLVTTDARRREVYWASFDDHVRTGGPGVIKPAELAPPHEVEAVVVPEAIVDTLPVSLRALPHVELTPRAMELVALADFFRAPAPLTPAYLRRPDAVPPQALPRSAAIPEIKGETI